MLKKFSWDRSKKQSIAGFIQTFSFLKFTRFFHDFLLKTLIYPWTLAKNDNFPRTLVSVTWPIVLKWRRQEFTEKKNRKKYNNKNSLLWAKKITKERMFLHENRKRIATYLSMNSIVNVLEVISIPLSRFHLKANPWK